MIEINGEYGSAKIYTDIVEEEAIAQVVSLLNQPYAQGQKIRMMPDIHAGAGCTIGTTMTITDKICPNLVGVDIGCGMLTVKLSRDSKLDFEKLDNALHGYNSTQIIVPSGFGVRDDELREYAIHVDLEDLFSIDSIDIDRALKSIGTLGGGNHFIEVDKDNDTGDVYLVIHTGSRYFGKQIAEHYQNLAAKSHAGPTKEERMALISYLKSTGNEKDINNALLELKQKHQKIPKDLAWCEGKLFQEYINDMQIAQQYARVNRKAIADIICNYMKWEIVESFETIHNYIDTKNMILRKGAVSAEFKEKLLIPMNMRDGSLICIGKGNPEWNCSAPHGAGRIMSRAKARESISIDDFEKTMNGIYTTSVSAETLDESPFAYKPMDEIISNIGQTVEIKSIIKPIYNFKAN